MSVSVAKDAGLKFTPYAAPTTHSAGAAASGGAAGAGGVLSPSVAAAEYSAYSYETTAPAYAAPAPAAEYALSFLLSFSLSVFRLLLTVCLMLTIVPH